MSCSSNITATPDRLHVLALGLVAALTILVYLPGLSGPFVFDDFGTLSRLGDLGGIDDWTTFRAFILGGDTGPTGRPLSLLTFLIDGSNWPTDSLPFKRTNLLLHVACGLLLYLVVQQLLGWLGYEAPRARRIAIAASALWLLHPFLVSTTLYAVQRMAQLATLFTFAGLALYLHGRRIVAARPRSAYVWMSAGLGGCTILAVLSKENGILLPLLAGVVEFSIIAARRPPAYRLNRTWTLLFIGLPAILLVGYLVNYVVEAGLFETRVTRGYSLYERLLTQGRVLAEYLREWFLPAPYSSGVFQDHVEHSEGWLSPPSTLIAWLFHTSAISAALCARKRWPVTAFAVLFFYTAHIIESTVINLELYFEHRNYLPAAFLFLPLLVGIESRLNARAFAGGCVVIGLLLATFTVNQASTWRSYPTMVEAAAMAQPNSARAQQQYAIQLYNAGRADQAIATIDGAIGRMPDRDALYLTQAILRCRTGGLDPDRMRELTARLGAKPWDLRLLNGHETLFNLVASSECPGVTMADLNGMYEKMQSVTANADPAGKHYFQVQYFLGLADLAMEDADAAGGHFRDALASRPSASRAMLMASLMANAERYDLAMAFTRDALRYSSAADRPFASRVDVEEIEAFQQRLRDAMSTKDNR